MGQPSPLPREAKPFPGRAVQEDSLEEAFQGPSEARRLSGPSVLLCGDCTSLCGPAFTGEPGSLEAGPWADPGCSSGTCQGMEQLEVRAQGEPHPRSPPAEAATEQRGSGWESVVQSALCVGDLTGLCNGRGSGRLAARNRRPRGHPEAAPRSGGPGHSHSRPPAGRGRPWDPSPLGLRRGHPALAPSHVLPPSPRPWPVSRNPPNLPPRQSRRPGSGPRAAPGSQLHPPAPTRDQDPPSSVHGVGGSTAGHGGPEESREHALGHCPRPLPSARPAPGPAGEAAGVRPAPADHTGQEPRGHCRPGGWERGPGVDGPR